MRKAILLLSILTVPLLLMACETVVAPVSPTMQAINQDSFATRSALEVDLAQSAARATQQAMDFQVTLQAQERRLAILRAEETRRAQETSTALEIARQAVELQLTREAWHVQLTATERAFQLTATEQARQDMLTGTAQAWSNQQTADAYYLARQKTAVAERIETTRIAEQATATRQAERREEVLAYGRDFGLPLLLLALLVFVIFLLIYGIRWWMRRPVQLDRDFRGDAHPFFVPTRDGYVLVDLDRQPGPAMIIRPDGTVEAPQLRSAAQEERTTARDQVVDLTTRPRLGAGARGQQPALPLAPPPSPMQGIRRVAVLRRLDQAATAGVLPPTLVATLEEDWRGDDGE